MDLEVTHHLEWVGRSAATSTSISDRFPGASHMLPRATTTRRPSADTRVHGRYPGLEPDIHGQRLDPSGVGPDPGQQNVVGLQIAVHDTGRVRRRQAAGDLGGNLERLPQTEAGAAQRLAVDELCALANVVDGSAGRIFSATSRFRRGSRAR